MFKRYDSVYTPTYATIDKTGERYYFEGDVMVQWRKIDEPKKIIEMTLNPEKEDSWYEQLDYYEQDDSLKGEYDYNEKRMLNAAYNTYEALRETPIGDLEGKVMSGKGEGLKGKTVRVVRESDEELLYKAETDDEGNYHIYINLDGEEVAIKVNEDEEYKEAETNGVIFADTALRYEYDLMLQNKNEEEQSTKATINIRTSEEDNSGEDDGSDGENSGSSGGNGIEGAHIKFRYGENNRDGEVIAEADSNEKGEIETNLSSGIYTAEITKEGYETAYVKVTVTDTELIITVYLVPKLKEGETGVLLTWDEPGNDSEKDLDLTIFTPYQGENGDMDHIGGDRTSDSHDNRILYDNKKGCEYGIINTEISGTYKVYVNNYTDAIEGKYNSDALAKMNVYIYIYTKDGLVADITFPMGTYGTVWEVVEISEDQVVPSSPRTCYGQVDKEWWSREKTGGDLEDYLVGEWNIPKVSSIITLVIYDDGTYDCEKFDGSMIHINKQKYQIKGNHIKFYIEDSGVSEYIVEKTQYKDMNWVGMRIAGVNDNYENLLTIDENETGWFCKVEDNNRREIEDANWSEVKNSIFAEDYGFIENPNSLYIPELDPNNRVEGFGTLYENKGWISINGYSIPYTKDKSDNIVLFLAPNEEITIQRKDIYYKHLQYDFEFQVVNLSYGDSEESFYITIGEGDM